jgi:hypothetical protein
MADSSSKSKQAIVLPARVAFKATGRLAAISELQRPFGKKREIEEGFSASLLGAAGGVYFQRGLFA